MRPAPITLASITYADYVEWLESLPTRTRFPWTQQEWDTMPYREKALEITLLAIREWKYSKEERNHCP